MTYIEVHFNIPVAHFAEILMAELAEIGFESFIETDQGFLAYIPEINFAESLFTSVYGYTDSCATYTWKSIPEENWNELWESQFEPVVIGDFCSIRAPFHLPIPGLKFDLIIEPKMSFGTGHHETTSMMISLMSDLDFNGKAVLDMGCGTGILSILASKMGAYLITGIDNDEWAWRNSKENIKRNGATNVTVVQGDASLLTEAESFDIVLANINRNILLQDMEHYSKVLKYDGIILLSGFYADDCAIILEKAGQFSIHKKRSICQNQWMSVILKKQNHA